MVIFLFIVIIIPWEHFELCNSEKLTTSIAIDIVKLHNTQCALILHPSRLHDTDHQEIFSTAKILLTDPHFQLFVSVSTFKNYINLREIRDRKTRCPAEMFIILGWFKNCREEFSEFTYKTSSMSTVWLVILKNDTAQNFLKEANTPFYRNMVIASIDGNNSVKLVEAYRVDHDYPLRIKDYMQWTTREFSSPPQIPVYSRRYDLEGVPLRASTKDDYPLCFLEKVSDEYKIGGYFGSLFYELAKNLNFTPVYVHASKNVTGAPINGAWDGLLGMLQKKDIDLSVGPHPIDNLMSVGSFVRPLFRTRFTIFFKQEGNKLEWGAIWKPFSYYIWVLISIWIFISSVVVNLLYTLECRFGNENFIYKVEFCWVNSLFYSLKALCQQGHERVPKSYTCRIIFLTSYVLSTVLVTAYSASLISHLTTREPTRPFDSLESFRDDGSYKLIAIGSSTDYAYFSEASDNLRKEIYERFMKPVPDSEFVLKKENGLDIICSKEKFAFFITFDIPNIVTRRYSDDPSRNCVILHLKSHLDTIFLTIVRRKDLPYADLIDREVIKYFDYGIAQRLQRKSWPLKENPTEDYITHYQVTLNQILQIHLILWFGMGLSIVIATLEILIYYRQKILLKLKKLESLYFLNIYK